jgi:hypothetical protein
MVAPPHTHQASDILRGRNSINAMLANETIQIAG